MVADAEDSLFRVHNVVFLCTGANETFYTCATHICSSTAADVVLFGYVMLDASSHTLPSTVTMNENANHSGMALGRINMLESR